MYTVFHKFKQNAKQIYVFQLRKKHNEKVECNQHKRDIINLFSKISSKNGYFLVVGVNADDTQFMKSVVLFPYFFHFFKKPSRNIQYKCFYVDMQKNY